MFRRGSGSPALVRRLAAQLRMWLVRKAVLQGVKQSIEGRVGQGDVRGLAEAPKGDGLMAITGIARYLGTEPCQRTESPRLPLSVELDGHKVHVARVYDLIDQGDPVTDPEFRAIVGDFPRADIEESMGVGDRNFGLLLFHTIRAIHPQDEQSSVFLKPHQGGTIRALWKEALDLAQTTPLPLDEAGQG